MRLSAVAALMIITTVLLASCGQDQLAVLDDRSHNFYSRNGIVAADSGPTVQAAEVTSVTSSNLPPPTQMAAAPISPSNSGWQWPVNGMVIQKFGAQTNGLGNEGIAIAAPEGTPIRAARAGEVAFIGANVKDFGNMVILRHSNGDLTSYSHARTVSVHKDEQIAAGAIIGYVGTSGG